MNDFPSFNGIVPGVLRPRLPIIGYIKIGGKNETKQKTTKGKEDFQMPVKYDHFKIRTRVRGPDGNFMLDERVHKEVGLKPTELPFRFLFPTPEENLTTALQAWDGGKLRCEGNGSQAFDRVLNKQIPCTCPLLKQHKGLYPLDSFPRPVGQLVCKPYAVLSVLLENFGMYGGRHIFRTTSWETISALTASLAHFQEAFGRIDWIPFTLKVYPHTVTYDGTKRTTAFGVAVLLRGSMEAAFQIAAGAQQKRQEAERLLAAPSAEEAIAELREVEKQDAADISSEFHPQAQDGADYEVVEDDEEVDSYPLEGRIRRALELAKYSTGAINKGFARHSDSLVDFALEVEKNHPAEWEQAGQEIAAAAQQAEQLHTSDAPPDASLDLFEEKK